MMKLTLTFLLIMAGTLSVRAQMNLDSLQQVLQRTTICTKNLQQYVHIVSRMDPNEVEAAHLIGNWIISHAVADSLLQQQAEAHCALGRFYMDISNYEKAAQYFTAGQSVAEKKNFYIVQAKALNGLAGIYYCNKQIFKAIEYYSKTVAISEKNGFTRGIAIARYNVGGLCLEAGFNNPDTVKMAFAMMRDGLQLIKQTPDTPSIITLSIGLSQSYTGIKKYDSALALLHQAESLIKASGNKKGYLLLYLRFAEVYNAQKNYREAIRYYHTGLTFTEKNNSPRLLYNYYEGLAETYALAGDHKRANEYNKLYIKVHDSLVSKENFAITADYQHRYERAKKDNEILKLNEANKKKETLNKIIAGSALVLLLLGVLAWFNIRGRARINAQREELYRQKISQLEKDKQLLAIDAMLKGQEEERGRIAKELHDGLGCLLSGTKLSFMHVKEHMVLTSETAVLFDKSLSMLDNTIGDLRKVAHNLMPEILMKFGLYEALQDFCNYIRFSTGMDIEFYQFGEKRKLDNTAQVYVYRIVQELVNNAVRHAEASQIIIQVTISPGIVRIEVEDNGKGFDPGQITSKGMGLTNISYRVKYFNGQISIVSAAGNGTSVHIELKM